MTGTLEEEVISETKDKVESPKGLWSESFKRLKRDKLAIFGGIVIIMLIIIAFLAPVISPYNPNTQFKNGTTTYGMPLPVSSYGRKIVATRKDASKAFTIKSSTVFVEENGKVKYRTVGNTKVKKGEKSVDVTVAVVSLNDAKSPSGIKMVVEKRDAKKYKDYNKIVNMINQEFDSMIVENDKYFSLGTDSSGRDSLSRLIWGSRISLLVGVCAIFVAVVIGTVMGLVAGFFGGIIDTIIMRITDIMMSVPDLLLVMAIVSIMGPSVWIIVFSIGIVTWTGIARIIRSQVFTVKEMEYIEASKSSGANNTFILVKHVLPNVIAPVIVVATMGIAGAIMTEAGLSFLGFGVKSPTASWGSMVNQGLGFFRDAAWVPIIPGLAIAVTVFAFNLFGDGVRDAIDPKLK